MKNITGPDRDHESNIDALNIIYLNLFSGFSQNHQERAKIMK